MHRWILVLSILVGGCAAAAEPAARDARDGSDRKVGQPLPDLQFDGLNGGKKIRLRDLKGKVVLLDLWASWCAPCKEELPILDEMAPRLRSAGIEIVGISVDENREDAEQFLRSRPRWSFELGHDGAGKLAAKLEPSKMPSSYVIDRAGLLRDVNAGYQRGDARKIEVRLSELAHSR
jgi:cytochrome c biogenesis protein CcmG, thiol:disulfide interchange protein DsbE